MNAGLTLSMETQISLPCYCRVMSFSDLLTTALGPSCKGFLRASCRSDTLVNFESSECTKTTLGQCKNVGMGLRLRIFRFNCCTNSELFMPAS
ncbi:hypothetical protein TNCT_426381 [Trichonephila clavata]|uniref:Uncharacterized protein n=1 Tax=Trichonephila clavata TaxID=2740835 RepID=A0A8X6LXN2_TRICU|nr:hypothetical protein TNCT_426381 [Trichonephila clavata]